MVTMVMKRFIKFLAIITTAVVTLAQQPTNPPASRAPLPSTNAPASRTFQSGTNPPSARMPQRFDRAALEVPPEHRSKLEEVNRAYATNATPIFTRLAAARRELDNLVNQDQSDQAALRAKATEIGDLEAKLAILRAKRYAQLRAFLTPEQARRFNLGAPMARPFEPRLHDGAQPAQIAPNK